jgi:hypothetical protein
MVLAADEGANNDLQGLLAIQASRSAFLRLSLAQGAVIMPDKHQWLARVERARNLADELDGFVWKCGPSDDPDEQSAYVAGYADIAIRFMAAVNRLRHSELVNELEKIGDPPENLVEAFRHHARLRAIADLVTEIAEDPGSHYSIVPNSRFCEGGDC